MVKHWVPPASDGEMLLDPPYGEWEQLIERNAAVTLRWPSWLREARETARSEIIDAAEEYSVRIGLEVSACQKSARLAMSGHQPEFFHPGVWAKNFLLERLTRDMGVRGINLVVDTDGVSEAGFIVPRLGAEVEISKLVLAEGYGAPWVKVPVPSPEARTAFRTQGRQALLGLPSRVFAERFECFCDGLDAAAAKATDLGMLMTMARRSYESPAHTAYLELPVSALATTHAFRRFAALILGDAVRFRDVHNTALGYYRAEARVRSAAQPFPDLAVSGERIEVPFWLLDGARRLPVYVDSQMRLYADDTMFLQAFSSPDETVRVLEENGIVLAPRAISLTLFTRLFVADLFLHGIGGGRYDQVTDVVMEQYFGVNAPAYCVASMTLLLPLGATAVTDEDVHAAARALKRFEHNPDEFLDEASFMSAEERARAHALAARKKELILALESADANRKKLGLEVRAVNAALAEVLAPLGERLAAEYGRVCSAARAWRVLGDREYPFFLFDPLEVSARVW